eukprot:131860-Prorocentrum_lima.AAC.1
MRRTNGSCTGPGGREREVRTTVSNRRAGGGEEEEPCLRPRGGTQCLRREVWQGAALSQDGP